MGQSSRYEQKLLATHYTSCCGMSASSELYAMNYGDHCLTPVPTCRCLSSWGQAQERVSNCDPRGGGGDFCIYGPPGQLSTMLCCLKVRIGKGFIGH